MRALLFCSLMFILVFGQAQPSPQEEQLMATLTTGNSLPAGLLSGRSLVLYESKFTLKELREAQTYFYQAGIDAINYVDIDYVLAGVDPLNAFVKYFNSRGLKFLIFFQRKGTDYFITVTDYTATKSLVDKTHTAWQQHNPSFTELLRSLYRLAIATQKKQNLLINEIPEMGLALTYFREHDTRFSPDVKFSKIAIPSFENESANKDLGILLKDNFPVKYELVDPKLTDAELDREGYKLVLRVLHTRGEVARDILGYDKTLTTKTLITGYFDHNLPKEKSIPADKPIYKFYFKNTEYGNIFVGSQWDADETWQDALRNHLVAMRKELQY